MKNVHTRYYFDLADMCPPHGGDRTAYSRFASGLRVLATVMTRLLPEYDVEAVVWRDTARLIFTRLKPDQEE